MPLPNSESSHVVLRCAVVGRLLSALAFLDGLIVLAGWTLDRPVLAGFGSGTLSTPNTAIALMAVAAGCWTAVPARQRQRRILASPRAGFSSALAVLAMFIGIATLAQMTMTGGLNIDRIFLSVVPAPLDGRFDVRMSVAAALSLTLLGAAVLTLNTVRAAWLTHSFAVAASGIGFFVLSGFLYDAAALAETPLVRGTALPTACGLLLAGLAIVAAHPRDGMMRLFTSADLGGAIFRRALLPVALTPVLINWLELSGERHGWYAASIGWTLDATITVGALSIITWGLASIIQRKDIAQRAASALVAESEERYRRLVESSPDAIIVKSGKRIEDVNLAALVMLGVTDRRELIGRSPLALVEPSRRGAIESQLCALLDEPGANIAVEDQVLRMDGTLVDVAVSASAVQVAGSRLVQVLMRDIGEKKRQEHVLRESEERFRLIAETITQVFWMADVNIQTMVYVSPAYEDVWGYSRDSVYQNPRSFLDAVHADDRARVLDDLKAKQAGLPFDHEYRIGRSDGQIRWIRDRGFPVHQAGQPVRVYVGVAEDITDRRQDAERLRESIERFELVERATHDAIWEFDLRTGAAWWGDRYRQLFGLGPEIVASFEQWSADIHPADRERVVESFTAALKGTSEEWSDEYRYRHSGGSFVTVHDRAFIVRDAVEHAPLRIVGSLQDVSAQRSTEAQFRQAQKMEAFGQLAGGVAHDFNNLLTAISGFADLLLADESPDSGRRLDLLEITEAARRAAALTRQLLLFSRREVMTISRLDVNEAIHNLTRMLTRTIGEDIHVELTLNPEPLFVDGDAGMFDQIIVNLAVNARDAMPTGGRLTIESTSEKVARIPASRRADAAPGPYVCVAVADTGEGIPPEILPRIFEPFFTTKAAGKGTGLGLATVFGIAEQHKGWLDVESRVGEGTTIRLWLPSSRSKAIPRHAPRQIAGVGGGGETILVVEDDTAVRALTRAVLSRNGYKVLVASDAIEALAVWQTNKETIHLLLTDMVMPSGMNGRELASKLQAEQQELKVLLISGYSVDFAGAQIGPDEQYGFLHKPFRPDQLLAAIRGALDSATGS